MLPKHKELPGRRLYLQEPSPAHKKTRKARFFIAGQTGGIIRETTARGAPVDEHIQFNLRSVLWTRP